MSGDGDNPARPVTFESTTDSIDPSSEEVVSNDTLFDSRAARIRAMLALLAMVIVSDLTIYRGEGFAGAAVFLLVAPAVLVIARPWFVCSVPTVFCGVMLFCLAGRLAWCGSFLAILSGGCVVVAFALSLNGRRPFVLQTLNFSGMTLPYGAEVLNQLGRGTRSVVTHEPTAQRAGCLSVVVPMLACAAFGLIFVLANPNLLNLISSEITPYFNSFANWLATFQPTELIFWIAVLWLTAGLVRPLFPAGDDDDSASDVLEQPVESTLYATGRNTLITLIALFSAYLVFEFRTLWFQEFPKGFYYAGYAHQGAAWLTAALALATLTLSLMFRGSMLNDPREPRLRRLAWIWSALNLLLAASVYNRLAIYIDFNGMTRMRTIGLFGTTTVVAGFLLTLWKIHHCRRFAWLVRRDLWAVAIAVALYAMTPVDWIVHTHNVRQAMKGDLAPVVQITEHPISVEGLLALGPLLECDDPIIQKGIAAMLTMEANALKSGSRGRVTNAASNHWTAWQWSVSTLRKQLDSSAARREQLIDANDDLADVFQEFRDYAFQWY